MTILFLKQIMKGIKKDKTEIEKESTDLRAKKTEEMVLDFDEYEGSLPPGRNFVTVEERNIKVTAVNLGILLLMIVVAVGLIYVGVKLTNDGTQCLKDPIVYYNSLGPDQCGCGSQKINFFAAEPHS